ncbi:MAG: DUF4278 domain-containing protein [Cyanobacteria bacterium P01_E01_bin.42]
MKLFYRGQSYTANKNTVATTNVVVEGKYRGARVTWQNKQARVKHADRLVYRGVRQAAS